MESEPRELDEILRKRYWLINNFEWFFNEAIFHRDMKRNFTDNKYKIWNYGEVEGKAQLYETAE